MPACVLKSQHLPELISWDADRKRNEKPQGTLVGPVPTRTPKGAGKDMGFRSRSGTLTSSVASLAGPLIHTVGMIIVLAILGLLCGLHEVVTSISHLAFSSFLTLL